MAGSYRHIVNEKDEFIGIDCIDNMGEEPFYLSDEWIDTTGK